MSSDSGKWFKDIIGMFIKHGFQDIKRFLSKKNYITKYLQNTKFDDYPRNWSQNSFVYGQELINYLQKNEYIFRDAIDSNESSVQEMGISSISGIELSQSDLSKYANFYEFSLFLSKDGKHKFTTDDDFEKNCKSINNIWESKMQLVRQTWNGKIFIRNEDGSHRLAAIYRQCQEQGRHYQIPSCSISNKSIDFCSLQKLLDDYYLVFSHHNNLSELYKQYCDLFSYDIKEKMALFDLNVRHKYPAIPKKSQILYLNKQYKFNNFIVEKLRRYTSKFLILNDELKSLYWK